MAKQKQQADETNEAPVKESNQVGRKLDVEAGTVTFGFGGKIGDVVLSLADLSPEIHGHALLFGVGTKAGNFMTSAKDKPGKHKALLAGIESLKAGTWNLPRAASAGGPATGLAAQRNAALALALSRETGERAKRICVKFGIDDISQVTTAHAADLWKSAKPAIRANILADAGYQTAVRELAGEGAGEDFI